MRISDWISDVCSSDLIDTGDTRDRLDAARKPATGDEHDHVDRLGDQPSRHGGDGFLDELLEPIECGRRAIGVDGGDAAGMPGIPGFQHVERFGRSEEHTSELQSLMRTSYAVFCLKKKITLTNNSKTTLYA